MKQLVIMPGGFHPFHTGHLELYNSIKRVFPGADVYVAATNDTSTRPFPFPVKEKLAQLAGVDKGRFMRVKSPFRAEEITASYDPDTTQLIFVRSEKDKDKPPIPGGVKKDGNPGYLQPLIGAKRLEPFARHAYMAYLPTVEFLPGMTGASDIRAEWPTLDEPGKIDRVMSLYPKTQTNPKLAATVVKLLDTAMGAVDESALDNLPRPNKRNQFKSLHRQRKQRGLDEQGMEKDLKEFATAGLDGEDDGEDDKTYLLQLAEDLSEAMYGPNKNKQAIDNVMVKIRAAGGNVKITWNADGTFNVAMYHPMYFKQGYLIRLVGQGDQDVAETLKPDAFKTLQQAKQNIKQNRQQEQQAKQRIEPERQQEVDQWVQDFRANSAKLAGQQLKRAVNPTPVPVAQPGEKHAVLKNRISQLDQAINKQQQLDALTQKLEHKGLLTPAMQMDFDTRMYVRDAAADDYQALNQKLDRAIVLATNRLRTNKLAFKKNPDYIEEGRKI